MGRFERHWPDYASEAICLALFMASACACGALLEHPGSAVNAALPDPDVRRLLMGCAMGLTAIALIYSPLGKRSGAHMNPAVTLTFLRLRKVAKADALAYTLAQFAGGLLGVAAMAWAMGGWISDPAVRFVATVPGSQGVAAAFATEAVIACAQMGIVLCVSNSRYSRFTGMCAGVAVATWIYWAAPISGMSMNPARSFGSAVMANEWRSIWIYFVAPPLGMLLAGELFVCVARRGARACAKLHHVEGFRCIFCEHVAGQAAAAGPRLRLVSRGEPSR